MWLLIEKRSGDYFVQHDEAEFVRQSITEALANVVESKYLNEISDLVKAYFEKWDVQELAIEGEGESWCAGVKVNSECFIVEESNIIAAIMALMTPVMLSRVAQQLKCFLSE